MPLPTYLCVVTASLNCCRLHAPCRLSSPVYLIVVFFLIYVWDKFYQKTVKVVMLLVFGIVSSNISFSLFDDNQKHHTEKINGLPNLQVMHAACTGCAPPVVDQPP